MKQQIHIYAGQRQSKIKYVYTIRIQHQKCKFENLKKARIFGKLIPIISLDNELIWAQATQIAVNIGTYLKEKFSEKFSFSNDIYEKITLENLKCL